MWKQWCYDWLNGDANFKFTSLKFTNHFKYGYQGYTVALKANVHRGMHLFIHLFKQSKPCIASTSERCILSASNSDMFRDLRAGLWAGRPNEQTDILSQKPKKCKQQCFYLVAQTMAHHHVSFDILCVFLFLTISKKAKDEVTDHCLILKTK